MNHSIFWKPALCGLFFLALSSTTFAQTATTSILADGAELKEVVTGLKFTEGPTADASGNVYFTDQPNDQILYYDFTTGKAETWMQPSGRSNGLYFDATNQDTPRLIACADEKNELWAINLKTRSHQVLAKEFDGRAMGGPNDCWVDGDGSIFFTDPLYQRPWWPNKMAEDHPRSVFHMTIDGKVRQVAADLTQPNGIIGDAERRELYVADIDAKTIYRYSIAQDGALTNKTVFCEMASDGLTIDENRNLYLTNGQGVTVFKTDGEPIENIKIPKGWTANVTFAGPENKHLFITASDSVYVIEMNVAGL